MPRIRADAAGMLCALLVTLAGCGSSSTPTDPGAAPTIGNQAADATSPKSPSESDLAKFGKAFSKQFPKLAADRDADAVADDAVNTCLDLSMGQDKKTIVKHVVARFDASPKQAQKIIKLVRAKACPAS